MTIILEYDTFKIHVSGTYHPGEKPIYYPVDDAHPGEGPHLMEQNAKLEGCLFDFISSGLTYQDIIDAANEKL